MNECLRPENPEKHTKLLFSRSTWFPALLRPALFLAAAFIVPQAVRATPAPGPSPSPAQWNAAVGAQSGDKGRQALAFLPNEIWIHAGDSITWRWDVDEIHTVTFLTANQIRPDFTTGPFTPSPATFDGTIEVTTPPLARPASYTVNFPNTGNFKLVCLVHERMTGVVHVFDRPHGFRTIRISMTGRPPIKGGIYSQIAMTISKRPAGNMAARGNTTTQWTHTW